MNAKAARPGRRIRRSAPSWRVSENTKPRVRRVDGIVAVPAGAGDQADDAVDRREPLQVVVVAVHDQRGAARERVPERREVGAVAVNSAGA